MMMEFHFRRRVCVALMLVVALAAGVLTPLPAKAADDGQRGFVDKVFKDDAGEHRYVVFVPIGYSSSQPAPVVFFLHGSG